MLDFSLFPGASVRHKYVSICMCACFGVFALSQGYGKLEHYFLFIFELSVAVFESVSILLFCNLFINNGMPILKSYTEMQRTSYISWSSPEILR